VAQNKRHMRDKQKKEQVISFQKTPDYYFQKASIAIQEQRYDKALVYFEKCVEADPESVSLHHKVAFALTETGRPELFNNVGSLARESLPEFLYLGGVLQCMWGDMHRAEEYLEEYLKLVPEGKLSFEAEKLLDDIKDTVLFQGNLNYVKLSNKYSGVTDFVREKLKAKFESPFVRVKMKESLYQLDDELIANVIFLYGLLEKNDRAERVLRHFVKSSWAKEEHIEMALMALKKIGAEEPYEVLMDCSFVKVTLKEYIQKMKDRDKTGNIWNEVLQCARGNMQRSGRYSEKSLREVKKLWTDYIKSVSPHVPDIDNIMSWAAGLEYTYLKLKKINVCSKHMALIYSVPHAALMEKYRLIERHCGVRQ